MTPLSLQSIREIAEREGYEEIDNNDASRLLSFRGGPSKSTRINVYYTTGTVGTCLNHPKRGKTQLFRRKVDVETLESIFRNPRVHTGGGYYYHRNSIAQRWKDDDTGKVLCDSARRWQYVGAVATGLIKNGREMDAIVDICTSWDGLYWQPGDRPDLLETRFSCGSHTALLDMLFAVCQISFGDIKCCPRKQADQYARGEIGRNDVDDEIPYSHECANEDAFLEKHADDVWALREKFLSLREVIRLELMQWFLSRDKCGLRFTNADFAILKSRYADEVVSAHWEYGAMMYPKKAGLCHQCGVVNNDV